MKIEYTKDAPETFSFKNVAIGDVFLFDYDEDAFIKISEVKSDIGEYGNAIELCSGDLHYFPENSEVQPVRHKLLIYKN